MSRRTLVLSIIASVVLSGVVAYAVAARRATLLTTPGDPRARASASGGLPVLWQSPAFSFPDQNGQRTASSDLRGHAFIADFIFTSCTSVCPLITAKMALLQRRLEHRRDLRFVSFSVDPTRDTPEALKGYAESWRPGETRWLLFSTAPETLAALAAGMYVSIDPGEKDIAHSQLFFLVDAQGGVRGIYESARDDALDRLVLDAESLLGTEPAAARPARAEGTTGATLYASLGCGACHARAELAPPLEGLTGRRVRLEGGAELVADTAYVRESVTAPDAKRVAGYPLRMPSYDAVLSPLELEALVAHVGAFAAAPAATGSVKPVPLRAPSDEPAATRSSANLAGATPNAAASVAAPPAVAVDPVCSMDVRVTDSTPRATNAGQTFYFCSPACRERFVAEPARYAKPAKP